MASRSSDRRPETRARLRRRERRPPRARHLHATRAFGTSPGKIGTAIAQQHLRSILAFCNSPLMNSIEAYVQFEPGLITDDGEVTNDATASFLREFMTEFSGFVVRVYTVLPRARSAGSDEPMGGTCLHRFGSAPNPWSSRRNRSGSAGLVTLSSNPASAVLCRSSACPHPVNATIRVAAISG